MCELHTCVHVVLHVCICEHACVHRRACLRAYACMCVHLNVCVCEWGEALRGGALADARNGALTRRPHQPRGRALHPHTSATARLGHFPCWSLLWGTGGDRPGQMAGDPCPPTPAQGSLGLGPAGADLGREPGGQWAHGGWEHVHLPTWRGMAREPQHAVPRSPQTSPQDSRGL